MNGLRTIKDGVDTKVKSKTKITHPEAGVELGEVRDGFLVEFSNLCEQGFRFLDPSVLHEPARAFRHPPADQKTNLWTQSIGGSRAMF